MRGYIIRRLLIMIPTLLALTFIAFFVVRLTPGNVIDAMLKQAGTLEAELDRAALEQLMGLDEPAIVQYGRWVGFLPQPDGNYDGVFQGNLGHSWWYSANVTELVANKGPVSLELGFMGLIIAILIGLPIGIYSALRQDTSGDYISRTFAILCISVPGFWLGTMIIVFPALWWGYMPPLMLVRFTEDPIGNLQMFIIPAIVLGMAMAGGNMRWSRTMMLEVLRQDYIRTAWAKGLRERVVIIRHALKNALIPVVTVWGMHVPFVLGSTVIIEQIFCLPGIGRLLVDAIKCRDEALVSGLILAMAVVVMLTNLVVDLTYAYLDPRIHFK